MKEHRLVTVSVGVALAAGVAFTLRGLRGMIFFVRPDHVIFVALAWGLVWSGAWYWRKSPYLIGATLMVCIALASGMMWPLFVTLWFGVAATLLGRGLLRVLQARGTNILTCFLVGAGIYGTGVGLLAHWPINYPLTYGTALALPLLVSRQVMISWYRLGKKALAQMQPASTAHMHWLDVSLTALALLYFFVALMPELGFDALWMHLFVPAHLAMRHQWGFDATHYVWAVIPMMGDWLFSLGYMLAGESAARLVNALFALALAWQVRAWALWIGSTTQGAKWAVVLFLTTSLTFAVGSSLFIESVLGAFVLAGTLALCRACFEDRRQNSNWMAAGILLGLALAAKATTLIFFPAIGLLWLWRYHNWLRQDRLRVLATASTALLLLGVVPYVTAWWRTGNPVFPFFNKIFLSPLWYPQNFEASAFGKGVTWNLLYQATFHSGRYFEGTPGSAGFHWLVLFLPVVVYIIVTRQWRGAVLLWLGVVTVVLAFRSTAYLRYVFPSLALLTAALGLLLSWGERTGGMKSRVLVLVSGGIACLNLLFLNAGAFYGDFPWRTLLSENDREQYLTRTMPMRTAVKMVNQLNVAQTPVLVLGHPRTAGLVADALYANWSCYPIESVLPTINDAAAAARLLNEHEVNYVLVDANWIPSMQPLVKLFGQVCDPLVTIGSVSVLKLKQEYRTHAELLLNGQPASAEHWTLSGSSHYDAAAGALVTNVKEPGFQSVKIKAGHTYTFALEARCYREKTTARLQINWSNATGRYLSTDIRTYDCTDNWERHQMEVVPPENAAHAGVYVTSHTTIPVAFRSISFR
jgi:hypothetical protein